MSQQIPDRQSQRQDNLIKDTTVGGNLIYNPQQIIEKQIIEVSVEKVTQKSLIKASPYKGLKRFNYGDQEYFFGRNELINKLFKAVNESSFCLVLGASGSGKSSVIRAGLIPELKKSPKWQKFYDFIFTPNQDPFESLHRCLLSEEKDYHFSESTVKVALQARPDTLNQVITDLKKDEEQWFFFIDQFEQLFTICPDIEKRNNFIKGIVQVAKNSSVKIVLAMRSDFLDQFGLYPNLSEITNNNIHLVTEMYPDELRQAIEQPAAKHGVVFEKGLVEQIIEEVDRQSGYLPLLQYTLNLLWESECTILGLNGRPQIEDRILNKTSYAALGGVRGALQKRVDEIYTDICQNNKDGELATKQIFLKLVNIVESELGSRAVSRRASRYEFVGEAVESILQSFIDENLLVSSYEYPIEKQLSVEIRRKGLGVSQKATIELAHEILLSCWKKLKNWLEEEKEAIIFKNWLAGETKRWLKIRADDESKANDELLKGSRLHQIVAYQQRNVFEKLGGLDQQEKEFVNASIDWFNRLQKEKETRRQRSIRTAWGITWISLVLMAAIFILWRQAEIANIKNITQSANFLLTLNKPFDALIPSLKAAKQLQRSFVPETNIQIEVVNLLRQAISEVRERNRLVNHKELVNSISFSNDGKTLASGSQDKTIKLWDVATGREIRTLEGHSGSVYSISFSDDGKTLASGSQDNIIKLWDVATGKEIRSLKEHQAQVLSVSFSNDGKTLASGSADKTIKLWDVATGREIRTLEGHSGSVYSISFSDDGKTLASGSADKTIKLWDVATGKEIRSLNEHKARVLSVSFSDDGKTLASGSADKTIKLWDVAMGREIRTLKRHTNSVYSISFSDDGKTLASGSADKTIKLWDVATGKEIISLEEHQAQVLSVSLSSDAKTLASASSDTTIKLWDISRNKPSRILKGHSLSVTSISFSPNGKTLASASSDKIIKLWDVSTANSSKDFTNDQANAFWSVIFSPDGKTLASASDNSSILIWDVSTEKVTKIFRGLEGPVYSINFSPDGKTLASASFDKTIKLRDVATGEEIRTLKGHTDQIWSTNFSPDGKTLASASADKTIKLWDVGTSKSTKTFTGHEGAVYSISFSPDGKTLASGSFDKTIKLWDVATGKEIRTLKGHTHWVRSVNFSPDGKTLASGSFDKTIKLWDVSTGNLLKTFTGHKDMVMSVNFSPDGKTLASASFDKTVILWNLTDDLWNLDLNGLIVRHCNWLRGYLQNNPDGQSNNKLCDDD